MRDRVGQDCAGQIRAEQHRFGEIRAGLALPGVPASASSLRAT